MNRFSKKLFEIYAFWVLEAFSFAMLFGFVLIA